MQQLAKRARIKGLTERTVAPGVHAGDGVLRSDVCAQSDDGSSLVIAGSVVFHRSNPSRRLFTVHDRHHHVHEDDVVRGDVAANGVFNLFRRNETVLGHVHGDFTLSHRLNRHLLVQSVILDEEHAQAADVQFGFGILLLGATEGRGRRRRIDDDVGARGDVRGGLEALFRLV